MRPRRGHERRTKWVEPTTKSRQDEEEDLPDEATVDEVMKGIRSQMKMMEKRMEEMQRAMTNLTRRQSARGSNVNGGNEASKWKAQAAQWRSRAEALEKESNNLRGSANGVRLATRMNSLQERQRVQAEALADREAAKTLEAEAVWAVNALQAAQSTVIQNF